MKYMVTWHERPMGSAADYEAAQKRILGTFAQWKMPASFNIQAFVVRVGEYGGHMLLETDNALDLHKLTSAFPAFTFSVAPVVDIGPAVAVEMEAIAWREALS